MIARKLFSSAALAVIILFAFAAHLEGQSQSYFMTFEMVSNGNGVITEVVGFEFTPPPIGHGAYSTDFYRDVLLTEPPRAIFDLPNGMQTAGGWYFVVAGPAEAGDYETARNRWTRNGANDMIIEGNAYEIRFTAPGSKAFLAFTNRLLVDVPFELWCLGKTANDMADDVKMIPWVYDEDGNDVFNFKLDHFASGEDNDPFTDWIYFVMPENNSPGEAGYNQFVLDAMNGNYNLGGQEHIARLVLMNWNLHQYESAPGAGDGPVDAVPETGTTFRISVANQFGVDIKPGSDPNSINCSNEKEVIPVAILSTENFDAASIDPATVLFGPAGAMEIHNKNHLEDVDQDGDLDAVFHFLFTESGLECNDTEAELTGFTYDGKFYVGHDAIRTVAMKQICDFSDPGVHEKNNIKLRIAADGRIAVGPEGAMEAMYPRHTCDTHIYTAGIWFGGIVDGNPVVAEASHSSEFKPSLVSNSDELFHVFDSSWPADKQNWPAEFCTANGKAVLLPGAENLVVQYNDYDGSPLHEAGPLGIEVRQRSLGYNTGETRDAIIILWEITNISEKMISNAYFGFWSDADIGDATDDNAAFFDDMGIIWDHDFKEQLFVNQPSIMAFAFLQTPDDNGVTNYTAFINGGQNPDPNTDAAQYSWLSGAQSYETDIQADIRFILSTGPVSLAPGEKTTIAGSILIAPAPEEPQN